MRSVILFYWFDLIVCFSKFSFHSFVLNVKWPFSKETVFLLWKYVLWLLKNFYRGSFFFPQKITSFCQMLLLNDIIISIRKLNNWRGCSSQINWINSVRSHNGRGLSHAVHFEVVLWSGFSCPWTSEGLPAADEGKGFVDQSRSGNNEGVVFILEDYLPNNDFHSSLIMIRVMWDWVLSITFNACYSHK